MAISGTMSDVSGKKSAGESPKGRPWEGGGQRRLAQAQTTTPRPTTPAPTTPKPTTPSPNTPKPTTPAPTTPKPTTPSPTTPRPTTPPPTTPLSTTPPPTTPLLTTPPPTTPLPTTPPPTTPLPTIPPPTTPLPTSPPPAATTPTPTPQNTPTPAPPPPTPPPPTPSPPPTTPTPTPRAPAPPAVTMPAPAPPLPPVRNFQFTNASSAVNETTPAPTKTVPPLPTQATLEQLAPAGAPNSFLTGGGGVTAVPMPAVKARGGGQGGMVVFGVVTGVIGLGVVLVLGCLLYLCVRKKQRNEAVCGGVFLPTKAPPGINPLYNTPNTPPLNRTPPLTPRSPHPVPPPWPASTPPRARTPPQGTPTTPRSYTPPHTPGTLHPPRAATPPPGTPEILAGGGVRAFTLGEVRRATNNFDEKVRLGAGGFGTVYFGVLQGGRQVAVKRGGEGQQDYVQFKNEVELLSRLHHRHLVVLLGFCCESGEQILIYEYMPGGNLTQHIKGLFKVLSLEQRLRIALGAARGLEYLHNWADPPILHRDVKSDNILLDENMEAKVADFGLSRLPPTPQAVSASTVKGTFGYIDPNYVMGHRLTERSDVYSFGVVLLQLISGRAAVDTNRKEGEWSVVEWSKPHLRAKNYGALTDPRLGGGDGGGGCYNQEEVMAALCSLAGKCVAKEQLRRPLMAEVVRVLQELVKAVEKDAVADPPAGTTQLDSTTSVGASLAAEFAWLSHSPPSTGGLPQSPQQRSPRTPTSRLTTLGDQRNIRLVEETSPSRQPKLVHEDLV